MRALKIILLVLLAVIVLGVVALMDMRAYRQHVNAQAIAIHAPNGIGEATYVPIGGIEQWIQIRGQDRANPVLLVLHGGPGGSWRHLTPLFLDWEKQFTVVQWDQRGAGKTLESTGADIASTMSVDRMAADGIEVAEFLRKHLHKDKVILLGHSWGSILGVQMAKRRPDLFYAYVGTGQVADMNASQKLSYAYVLDKARAAKDEKAVEKLQAIGPPPFQTMDNIVAFFMTLPDYEPASDRHAMASLGSALTAPDFSLRDVVNLARGFMTVPTLAVYREMLSADLRSQAADFRIPVLFFQGSDDARTQLSVAREYFDAIHAPRKEFVVLEGGGHFAVWSMRDQVLRELIARVRSLAQATVPIRSHPAG